jgi:hypothetical protein
VKKSLSEYQRFDELMGKIARVSHTELKAKLDKMKKDKKRKAKKPSASGRA